MDSTALTAAALNQLRNIRLYAETYGCTYNFGDTEKIIEIARSQGCTIVETAEDADAVLINTCIVVTRTEEHMYERMRLYADKILVVTGCLPGLSIDCVLSVHPDAYIIDPDLIHSCYREVGTYMQGIMQFYRSQRGVMATVPTALPGLPGESW